MRLPAACPSYGRIGFDPHDPQRAGVDGMRKCWATSFIGRHQGRCLGDVSPLDDLGLCNKHKFDLRASL